MYHAPAPPTTSLHGDPAGEEDEKRHEKKPVLKKVMDKVKKIKKAIGKKSPGHGNEDEDDDHHQHGGLDEGDDGYEEDEELKEDPAIHGVPHSDSGFGVGAKEISRGGGEGTKGTGDGLKFISEEFDESQSKSRTDPETASGIEQNRTLPNAGIDQTREYESPATGDKTGAMEISGRGEAGEGAEGIGDSLNLSKESAGDQARPRNEAESNTGIEQSRAYESPATTVRTRENEIPGSEANAERVGDDLVMISGESVEDPGAPKIEGEGNSGIEQNRDFSSVYDGPAIGANDILGGGREGAEREGDGDGDGLRLTTEKFVGDLAPPKSGAEWNTGIEQSQAYVSPATIGRTGANELSGSGGGVESLGDGLGTIKEETVENSVAPMTEGETNTGIQQSRSFPSVHNSPVTGAISRPNDILGGGEEGAERVNDVSPSITGEFIEVPTAATTQTEMNTRNYQIYESPTTRARQGANEMLGGVVGAEGVDDGSRLITKDIVKDPVVPSADDEANTSIGRSQVHLSPKTGSRTGVNEMYEGGEPEGAEGMGDGFGLTPMELVLDPAAPNIEAETNTKTEQSRGGQEVEVSPELCRSLEAMTVNSQNDGGETELSRDKNKSYTDMVSSTASKVYGMVADAGTVVISKVMPDARKDGQDEAVGKQGMGISIKNYITEKLTPGDDEKVLSELITEGGQKRSNAAVEVPPPENTSSQESGRGIGVVEKIRDTVASFLGGGEGSPKSTATEAQMKGDSNDFLRRTPEAISHEKRSSEELPSSFHSDDTRID